VLRPSPSSSAPLCPALALTEAGFGFSCQAFAYISQHIPTAGRNQLLQEYSPTFPYHVLFFPLQVYLRQTCHKEKDPVPALTLLLTRQVSSSCLQDKGEALPPVGLVVFCLCSSRDKSLARMSFLPGNDRYCQVNPVVHRNIRVTFQKKGK